MRNIEVANNDILRGLGVEEAAGNTVKANL